MAIQVRKIKTSRRDGGNEARNDVAIILIVKEATNKVLGFVNGIMSDDVTENEGHRHFLPVRQTLLHFNKEN